LPLTEIDVAAVVDVVATAALARCAIDRRRERGIAPCTGAARVST
jgi:hypothetical protein